MDSDHGLRFFTERRLCAAETLSGMSDPAMPIVLEVRNDDGRKVFDALRDDRAGIRKALDRHGAILFRCNAFRGPADLAKTLGALGFRPVEYPFLTDNHRSTISPGVVNASSTPPDMPVPPHSEQAFSRHRPGTVAFLCLQPAAEGGETPIHDLVAALQMISPAVRQRLDGARFVKEAYRMTEEGLTANFGTSDKAKITQLCRDLGVEHRWEAGRLSIRVMAPCLVRHPSTGENAISGFWTAASIHDFFRRFPGSPGASRRLTRVAGLLDVRTFEFIARVFHPFFRRDYRYSFETDGVRRRLSAAARLEILNAIWSNTVVFRWAPGDLLVIDNLKVGHSRMPYLGSRRVLASICDYVDTEPLMFRLGA